jgi:hypothetical protein
MILEIRFANVSQMQEYNVVIARHADASSISV